MRSSPGSDPSLRRDDGSLDRAGLGRIVFADPEALRDLEAIVHPAVRPRILEAVAAAEKAGAPAIVIEAIKLIEGRLADACDEVWLVTCDPADQRARLAGRATAAVDIDQRVDAQAGFDERVRPHATRVIDTSGEPATTRATWTARSTTRSARPGPARRCEAADRAPSDPERPFCSFGDW